jgi:hypothetical protein
LRDVPQVRNGGDAKGRPPAAHQAQQAGWRLRRQRKEAGRMLILKRLAIWLLEVVLEAFLLSVVLVCLLGDDQHKYAKDLTVSFVWIGSMFFSTGYLFTTAIARAVWRGRTVLLYPVVAVLLFLVHFEILNYSAGGVFDIQKRVVIRVAGVCIVLACTFAGNLTLRKWTVERFTL